MGTEEKKEGTVAAAGTTTVKTAKDNKSDKPKKEWTPEEIEEAKEAEIEKEYKKLEHKYGEGKVYVIRIEDKVGYLRKPDRAAYAKALGFMTPVPPTKPNPDPVNAGITLVVACWIGGDEAMKINDDYLIPAALQAVGLLKIKTAELTKK